MGIRVNRLLSKRVRGQVPEPDGTIGLRATSNSDMAACRFLEMP